ncbi:Phosphonopyruvate hydrolase [Pseudomonas fluorescens]|uniref:phosphoenolpyruvate mutase n=1 Tax=Pseudomonas fluorescens TaxID=294 RepID=UPI001258F61A|nr:phosphoenolpyruvate mutase [Pseudomonas fluorescens]VVQ22076.1 Phosphonopyruvate hydrolase [Pseudomonas fluorescens]
MSDGMLGGITAENRCAALDKLLRWNAGVRVMEVHSPLCALLVEKIFHMEKGVRTEFDAFWSSSLTNSTMLGKPDIELIGVSERFSSVSDIFEVTTKPLIFDADTGGLPEHLSHHVRSAERLGISAFIIEDKTGLKKNSLLGNDVRQTQASVLEFSEKISEVKRSQLTSEFLLIARVESLVLDAGMKDAIYRALAYVEAGADGIMIHSREKSPFQVLEFARIFRSYHQNVPLVCVPTTFNDIHYDDLIESGFNVVIYANHLLRAAYPAMHFVASEILKKGCTAEVEKHCLAIRIF